MSGGAVFLVDDMQLTYPFCPELPAARFMPESLAVAGICQQVLFKNYLVGDKKEGGAGAELPPQH